MPRRRPQGGVWCDVHPLPYSADMEDHGHGATASTDTIPFAWQACHAQLSGLPRRLDTSTVQRNSHRLLRMPPYGLSADLKSRSCGGGVFDRVRSVSQGVCIPMGNWFRSLACEVSPEWSPPLNTMRGVSQDPKFQEYADRVLCLSPVGLPVDHGSEPLRRTIPDELPNMPYSDCMEALCVLT